MITLRVHPRASRRRAEWKDGVLHVWVTAPPVGGAANRAVLEAVAREMGVAVSALTLRSGARGRTKLVELAGSGRAKSAAHTEPVNPASQIAHRALELAHGFLTQSEAELLDMAEGDPNALFDASQMVRKQASAGKASEHSAEHLAFSLITSAHEALRKSST